MATSSPIAALDTKRQITLIDRHGQVRPQSPGVDLLWASWGTFDPSDVHSWPTWSPDGQRIAVFRIARSGAGNRVWVTEIDGVESAEICNLETRLPIYLQWSNDSRGLAILSQDGDHLVLEHARPDHVDDARRVLAGSPLFFAWLDDHRIAAFVGEPGGPHLAVVDPESGLRHDLPGQPGNFCAPIALPNAIVYVAHRQGRISLLVAPPDSGDVREIDEVDGLAAVVASPDRTALAVAVAPDGSGASYRDLRLIDLASGDSRALCELDCIAFFWLPTGDGLILACQDQRDAAVTWHHLGLDGEHVRLFEAHPTRDLRFYLRFFEQFCTSHPIVDPSGQTFLVAGVHGKATEESIPKIWAVPLDGSEPEPLCDGLFAVFGPEGA